MKASTRDITRQLAGTLRKALGPEYHLKNLTILPAAGGQSVRVSIEEVPDPGESVRQAGNPAWRRIVEEHLYREEADGAGILSWPDINGDWCHCEKRPDGIRGFFREGLLSVDGMSPETRIQSYQDVIHNRIREAGLKPVSLHIIRIFTDTDPLLVP